jgi:hypothetical protein
MDYDDKEEGREKSFSEKLSVAGGELLDTIKRLIAEGNARSVILWSESGKKLLEIPLTGGVALGGAAIVLAPFVAAIAAIAAVATKVRLEVIRKEE